MYRYYLTMRPPAPGAVPRGAVNVDYNEFTATDAGGHVLHILGAVEYDRELTPKEICDYELIEDGEIEV